MIAKYVIREYAHDSVLYGIQREPMSSNGITKITCDMAHDTAKLSQIITVIKPDIIIHLAGISSAKYALDHPLKTLETNGLVVARICELLYRLMQEHAPYTCKLFNASSCEIYKGHEVYHVKEDDTHKYHIHPYSIAKSMGHDMVKFYRERYGMPFVNGVLFTIESCDKHPEFLFKQGCKILECTRLYPNITIGSFRFNTQYFTCK